MTEHMTTLEQVERFAADQGIALSPSERKKIAEVQAAEHRRLVDLNPEPESGFVDRFNTFYPRFLESLHGIGETFLTLLQTLIVAFGVPLTLGLLLIVEHQRVFHGIELFEADPHLASFAAWALVILNLVIEFQVHYVEQTEGYHQQRATVWSLRTWLANAAYRLGTSSEWTVREKSPAARYRWLLSLVTFTILALALAGSMKTAIAQHDSAWHVAIMAIVTDSTLSEMMTWVGGLLFAAAAVLAAQGLSRYVALRCAEILADMHADQQTEPQQRFADEIESAGAIVALAIVNEKIQKRVAKAAERRPFGSTAPDMADPESMPATLSANGHIVSASADGVTK